MMLVLVGCGEPIVGEVPGGDVPAGSPRVVTERTPELDAVLTGADAFSLDVYSELLATEDGNLFISPYSMVAALGMATAGAGGETRDEMAAMLGIQEEAAYHEALGALTQDLNGELGRPYTLQIANKVFLSDELPVEQAFLDVTGEHYGAPAESLSFGDPEPARQTINQWVSDHTAQKIPNLLPSGSITPTTQFVLTNAIYFLGDWAHAFDPADTESGLFQTDGGSVTADLMHQNGEFKLYEDADLQVLRLPYLGEEVSMWVILPAEGVALSDVEATLSPDLLVAWEQGMSATTLDVTLPKWEVRSELLLNSALQNLGMQQAFTEDADLTRISPDVDMYISGVYHQAFVKVDEKGTEAAAATAVVGEADSVPPEFTADRPFTYLIRDELTGAILFMGRLVDPTAG